MKQIISGSLLFFLLNSCGNIKTPISDHDFNPNETAGFTIAFGSCNMANLPQPLWQGILDERPEVFIWGGDIVYASTRDMAALEEDYIKQNAQPGYLKLKENTTILATWDDHDYGMNDGGANWEHKQESQALFLDFLEVDQNSPRREREGIYHSQTFKTGQGSIKIILLDTRYFRSDLKKSAKPEKRYDPISSGTILGEEQWQWMENELRSSTADFNVIVSSIQVLAYEHGFETWGNFPHEVEKMKGIIGATTAKNVVILSGDRHISEFSKTEIPGLEYPLVDFTSSGMTHTYTSFSGEPNQYRKGTVINDLSFGVLHFNFDKKTLTMQMRGEGNTLQQELIQVYK